MIGIRKDIPEIIREKKSLAIAHAILGSKEYMDCGKVFCYLSYKTEVSTVEFIKAVLKDGKRIALPYMEDNENMCFIEIHTLEGLVRNSTGIYEPAFDKSSVCTPDDDTLVVVPGLAFTTDGFRLGWGGGYYDRYLSRHKTMKNIGICFSEQLVESLPTEKSDIRLDRVIYY